MSGVCDIFDTILGRILQGAHLRDSPTVGTECGCGDTLLSKFHLELLKAFEQTADVALLDHLSPMSI